MRGSKNGEMTTRTAMNDARTRLVVLLLRAPEILERGQGSQN